VSFHAPLPTSSLSGEASGLPPPRTAFVRSWAALRAGEPPGRVLLTG
jgi:hypothetical protein